MTDNSSAPAFRNESDRRNAAGGLSTGFRKVKNGRIVFDGNIYQDERLNNYEGESLYVQDAADDAFANGPVKIYEDGSRWVGSKFICEVESNYCKSKRNHP